MGCSCAADAPAVMPRPWRNAKVVTSVCSGLLLLLGFVGGYLGLRAELQTIFYLMSVLVGGYYFGREALEELVKEREIGIELLMSAAAIVAGVMGQWAEAATLVFLYSISEAAEGYTAERARHAIRALMDLAPKTALVRRGDQETRIPVEQLRVGDIFIVLPGESVATDGEVIDGHSSVNQAPVTGESVPVEKLPGGKVFAATLNGEGALTVRAAKTFADNTLSRIIHLVEAAQASKGRSQRFIERFGKRYSPAVLGAGILIGLLPPLFGLPWQDWITRATVFVVAAAPCALVISIPITLVAAIGTAGRNGLLIKGGVHLENLAKVRVVALDKTGTLTLGRPQVTDVVPLDGKSEREVLAAAAALELRSQHPLAQAVLERAKSEGIPLNPAQDFQSLTGAGAKGLVEGVECFVGNPRLFEGLGVAVAAVTPRIEALQREGKTVMLVGTAHAIHGLIAVADPLRPEAARTIADLKRAGIERVVMLTGDNPLAAEAIARQVGVDEVFAELSPEDKTRKVAELEARHGKVVMIGDGVNDAPALAAAHVGVAMGAAGTDVALETADVALMSDNLARLPYLIAFSRRTWQVIRQNLALSAVVIGALIAGAVGGYFTLPVAVLAHEISEFVVIASGLRMLKT
ncbi:heavy metal translocating P-type ATPase [Methylococcus capsulatus]|uniref:heavy metal translocating P-type ATPase n=1 Tax=Methylococcus capsulatus TaxID=414 RepID=UPI001C528A2D|nr:cation-translocating P-type ATPase [Methylococcus capsulatus]QXP89194.1 cation-translocating P-type ATPase [Methylococcus capsulatus]